MSDGVQLWMRVMQLVFFASILFVIWHKFARYILLIIIATAAILIFGKPFFAQVPLSLYGSITQIVLWSPILVAIIIKRHEILGYIKTPVWHSKAYGIWIVLVFCTMAISLSLNMKQLLN